MIKLAYASFGRQPPTELLAPQLALLWVFCAVFVGLALVATVILNCFALFAGTLILFLGRPEVEFRFLRVFGSVPAIGLALPALLSYAMWHEAQNRGAGWALAQVIAISMLAAASVAFCAGWRVLVLGKQRR